MWRVIGVCLLAMAIGAASAYAQDGTTTGTSTDVTTTAPTTATTPPPPPPDPPKIADGVTVAGVAVGGMTAEEAAAALTDFWRRPFVLTLGSRVWTPSAARLGGSTDISAAVTQALAAAPLGSLTLPVNVNRDALRLYVSRRARETYRPAVNSTVRLKSLRPFVSKGRPGRRVMQGETRTLVRAALKAHGRGPVTLPTEVVKQTVTRRNFGPVRRPARLAPLVPLQRHDVPGVVRGRDGHGRVPHADRTLPHGLEGALAVVVPAVGLLGGRREPGSAGHQQPARHALDGPVRRRRRHPRHPERLFDRLLGLARVHPHADPEAEWLFERVRVGTHVFIVRA